MPELVIFGGMVVVGVVAIVALAFGKGVLFDASRENVRLRVPSAKS